MTKVEPLRSGLAGATTPYDAKNEFKEQLRRDGFSNDTVKGCLQLLNRMERKGVNVLDAEQVKGFIAEQDWENHSRATAVSLYGVFAKVTRIQWNPPRYRYEQKIPFIPLEKGVNDLIAGCGRKMSVFLRLLTETGMRCGEARKLRWEDFDFERSIVTVNHPEKGSLPRVLPISPALKAALNCLPRRSHLTFPVSMNTLQHNFYCQRNRLAVKLQNPRLRQIHFHSLRHFFATMLYAKTLNIRKVQSALGHKNLNNTDIYTHLIDFKADEFEVQIAETVAEAKKLAEAGFEPFDKFEERHLYKRRK